MKSLIVFLTVILIGCSEDSPVNNSVNNPTPTIDTVTLFTKDSIYAGSPYQGRDSVEYLCSLNIDTIRCSFVLSSQNVLGVQIKFNSLDSLLSLPPVYNQGFDFQLPIGQSNFNSKLYLELRGATPPTYYASLKNIRLWYIRR